MQHRFRALISESSATGLGPAKPGLRRGIARLGLTLFLAALTTTNAATNSAATATNRFGFSGREVFPIDQQISLLQAADLDGDGLQDLIVVNNLRSKISLLYNRTGKPDAPRTALPVVKRELNELPPDARFRIDSIASEKRIASLVVADLNSDGQPDLAYYGEPKELVILYHETTNGWSTPKRWPIEDGLISPNSLVHGDLNHDERTDLILVGENHLYFFLQKADHTFGEPEKVPYSGALKAVQILDLDGDGRQDLLLVNWDNPNPFRFRLQNGEGQFGPELYFPLSPLRSYLADDLNHDRKPEVVTIALNSGRAQLSVFTQKPSEPLVGNLRQGQFQVLPLAKATKAAKRGQVWADVDGDQRPDLIVAEPDSGQLTVYLQQTNGSLATAKSFPTLTGVGWIVAADWDDDRRTELFLLSHDEQRIGVTRMDAHGRIGFPTILSFEGRPLAMAVGKFQPDDPPTLAAILDQDGKRVLVTQTADGQPKVQKLSADFKASDATLAFHDVDQDGRADLVVLIPYEKVKILRSRAGPDFEELDLAPPGGNVEKPWMSLADVDGDERPELLLAQKNFLRAVVLEQETVGSAANGTNTSRTNWVFRVRDQINGAAASSRLVGAASLTQGTNRVATLFLLDAERKALTVCERDAAGVWQAVRNVTLPFTEFTSLQAIALGAPTPNSIAFLGLNAVAWMQFSGSVWEFKELDGYETPIKDGFLRDVVFGDLDQDGIKDLVFLETAKNYVDLVAFDSPNHLTPANRWPVFEERTFRNRRADTFEPREALVVDVTGDGKNDLILLVHDRVVVYPQE